MGLSGEDGALRGRTVAVPESRALDMFSDMIAAHGAEIIRCPLVRVRPLEDNKALDAWIGRLTAGGHDLLAFYTGEGVVRIVDRAEEIGAKDAVLEAFARLPKLVRGPKPLGALRKLGCGDWITKAGQPTTDGLIALIAGLEARGTIGFQVYPDAPEDRLADACRQHGFGYDPVTPYVYAADESDGAVVEVIRKMAAGEIDLIAFTSQSQVQRLIEVAERRGLRAELGKALASTRIAAVGPITEQAVVEAGGEVQIRPEVFHMKPLVAEMVQQMGAAP
ncbi:MAG: uroporphyrinogen-III synthase [Sphingomicrobium sp.]